ncbi:MAG TPA: hypothetical protein VGK74_10775 [Symbiobacteriaceae bacterium]|jgi:hypothetical protein
MSKRVLDQRDSGYLPPSNLARLTDGLARGLHLPVKVESAIMLEGADLVGFVVRLDDGAFGPIAVVHVPDGNRMRVLYRDPDELTIITPDSLRIS